MGEIKPQKTDNLAIISLFGTQTRDRTGMEVNPLVFETSASTDSAIWAVGLLCFLKHGKGNYSFLDMKIFLHKFFLLPLPK